MTNNYPRAIMVALLLSIAPAIGPAQLFAQAAAPATKPTDQAADELSTSVRRLVRQLDASEQRRRDEAEAELLKLGPSVLEHLPTVTDKTTPAARDTFARLQKQFEQKAADETMRPTTVTLAGKAMPLSKAVAELTRLTGNKVIVDDELGTAKVDVALTDVPFLKALDTIADQAKLTVYSFGDEGTLALVNKPNLQLPRVARSHYAGPLRFEAGAITAQRNLRQASEGTLRVSLQVDWEPRLRPITLLQPLDAITALDENGRTLTLEAGDREIPVLVQAGSAGTEFDIPLQMPPRSTKSIASLRGKLSVLVPGKVENFEFTDIKDAKRVAQKKANATVTLDEVRKNNDIWEVRMRIKFEQAHSSFESHLAGWILNNPAVLIDAAGVTIENAGFESTLRSEDEIGIAYFFELKDGPAGHKFVYRSPATIYNLPVEYELKDLMLP